MHHKQLLINSNDAALSVPRDGIYLISELADAVGLEPQTIRYYEAEGLLQPHKHGRFKFYGQQDAEHLIVIKKLRKYGFSIERLREIISLEGRPLTSGQYANQKSAEIIKDQYLKTAAAVVGAQAMLREFEECIDIMKMS